MSDNNLRHWSALYQTDPAHTKPFTRSGGFRGTAIKPIYATQKMTEHFGPCGIGWGMTKPDFTVQVVGDEIAVYCTVGLWFMDADQRSELVYGVGGDVVAKARRDGGVMLDDEAFKKSFTDAIGNAMKHLGVGGDVHMGQFDDSKYRDEVAREIEQRKHEQNEQKGDRGNDGGNPDDHFLNDPRSKSGDFRAVAEHIRDVIDSYNDIVELNKRAVELGFRPGNQNQPREGSLAAMVKSVKSETYNFLMDRLSKRRGTLAQTIDTSKAA